MSDAGTGINQIFTYSRIPAVNQMFTQMAQQWSFPRDWTRYDVVNIRCD